MLSIRLEKPEDVELIYKLNKSAFGQADEAKLVDALTVLKQKLSPNKPQTSFISNKYVTVLVQPLDKTIRYGCTKSLQCFRKSV
jgi:hypothetical protein